MPDEASGAHAPLDWLTPPGPTEPPSLQLVPPPWLNRDEALAHRPDLGRSAAGFEGYGAEEPLRDIRGPSGSARVGLLPGRDIREIPSGGLAKEMGDPTKEPINKVVFRKQFKKTQMCRFFQRSACRKGDSCEFAHGPQELAQPPDLRRTSLCKAFMEGCCPESAETCRFAHGIAMLRRTQGFEKVVLNKEPQEEDTAVFGYESQQVQLHHMLRQQQREQEEMRQVIEEQRRKIAELKMQQERLQQAQLAMQPPMLPFGSAMNFPPPFAEAQPPFFRDQPTLLPNLGGGGCSGCPPPPEAQQFKSIPL